MGKQFTQAQLEAIAGALGDTDDGLKNSEIQFLFSSSRMDDPGEMTKRHRIYNAFAQSQNVHQHRKNILEFIRLSMDPARYSREPQRYEPMRTNVNKALAFAGLVVTEAGKLGTAKNAATLTEAQCRANSLRSDLQVRGVHSRVLEFCRAELLADDYFHAVQEATKSIADKLRSMTGATADGAQLVDQCLTGSAPMVRINQLQTESEKSEQKGFANLLKGVFGMFRNPTAHEARIKWSMRKEDAEDLLTTVSLIHRRLDRAC